MNVKNRLSNTSNTSVGNGCSTAVVLLRHSAVCFVLLIWSYFLSMSQIYYVKEYTDTGRRPGPSGVLSPDELATLTGIRCRQVKFDPVHYEASLARIPEAQLYDYQDVVDVSPGTLGPEYRKKLATFEREHLHGNDEVRLILEGSAFYEIRDLEDNWIRMNAVPGDFISIPKGAFHRFFLDQYQRVKAVRLFAKDPQWAGYYRSQGADEHPARLEYLQNMRAQNWN